jgi:hypothetical protein
VRPRRLNLTVTALASFILTVHVVAELESQPVHPPKPESKSGDAVRTTVVPDKYDSEQSEPQLIPVGFEVTVPLPKPVLKTDSVNCCSVNVAVTDFAAFIVTVQVAPETLSHPLHPPKREPALAPAVSVTTVSLAYGSEQSVPQLTPVGLDVTVPLPFPDLPTVSVKVRRVNVAVTVFAAFIVTEQVAPETLSHPLQPPNVEFVLACAVSVTTVPLLYEAEQIAPQLIPDGLDVTVPPPVPVLLTASV